LPGAGRLDTIRTCVTRGCSRRSPPRSGCSRSP
jgi:hypothetical protein